MPTKINGKVFYTTSEICEEAGISRPTLFRWLRLGMFEEIRKNSRGWRIFTENELNKVKAQTMRIEVQKCNEEGQKRVEAIYRGRYKPNQI